MFWHAAPLPERFRDLGSMQFSTLMVEKSGVVVSPGVGCSASTAKAMSASPWWKTSREFARLHGAFATSLKAALKRCTTWFLSPTGGRRQSGERLSGLSLGSCPARRFSSRFVMVAPLKVGIAGLGTVGSAVVRLIEQQSRALSARCGRGVRVVAVAARSKTKKRDVDLTDIAWAKDAWRWRTIPASTASLS